MTLPIETLLPLRALTITLCFTESSRPRFFHQAALTAFLRFLAHSPAHYDQLIRIDAPESGVVKYQAGDYYRFVLLGLAGSDALLDHLLLQLSHLPNSAPKGSETGDNHIPFRDNLRLVSVHDFFDEREIHQLSDACVYDYEDLLAEASLWQTQRLVRWQWLSPARLLKAKAQRNGIRGEARFVRDAADLSAGLVLERVYSATASLIRERENTKLPSVDVPDVMLSHAHVFWLETRYANAQGKNQVMGGMAGVLQFALPETLALDWWVLLILGQYLGIGQRTAFGWGRYTLLNGEGAQSYRAVLALNSLLMQAKEEENLRQAWRHVVTGRDIPQDLADDTEDDPYHCWHDDHEPTEDDLPLERLQMDFERMLFGQYAAPALRGYVIPKKNGGMRPLAIPPLYDRILQRALQQVLSPALEQIMYQHSYGYRAGRSRMTASEVIQRAWREGYQWVYEGDVRDFFDSVDWQILRERLEAFYYHDPVVNQLLDWMAAPVVFEGETIQRQQGLPQGSPLSPLLANLILDDFWAK